ncbi:MAG: neutral zinc metallopeptidase [Paramuribaculum sp.]|nr:neutral zinc metallopeptidase [Paramuribaculum sp.]
MNLSGRRKSSNVEDRRGMSGKGKLVGGGIVGIIIAAAITLFSGGDLSDVIQSTGILQGDAFSMGGSQQQLSAEDEQLADFASKILAGTEDVWTELFSRNGLKYEAPRLVLFSGSVQSGCGGASSSMGPFYCSADQTVYLDLSFFKDMQRTIGAGGDFAYAYVIAHEVGHHVQYLLGTLDEAHSAMSRMNERDANKISVRLELQADYYAGVWAHHDNRMFGSLEPGDVEEAITAASKIGDDYLQMKSQGYTVPDAFNHGTSAQRQRWLQKGINTGSVSGGDTFSPSYSSL